jgi:hypothetical protein
LTPFVCKAQTIFWAFEYWQRINPLPPPLTNPSHFLQHIYFSLLDFLAMDARS